MEKVTLETLHGGAVVDLFNVEYEKVLSNINDEWLTARRVSIGGSDAGAVMGLNKWASALTVYLDKKGLRSFEGEHRNRTGQLA